MWYVSWMQQTEEAVARRYEDNTKTCNGHVTNEIHYYFITANNFI
jgi:hypothetical protein